LKNLIVEITKLVKAPSYAKSPTNGASLATVYDMWAANPDGGVFTETLGSGSDFTPFLQHAGIPALDLRIVDLDDSYEAAYHSIYDSYHWMTTFGDTTGEYFQALARVWGGIALRLADEKILPFNMIDYGIALKKYVDDAVAFSKTVPGGNQLDFSAMLSAVTKYQEAANKFHSEIDGVGQSGTVATDNLPYIARIYNDRLMVLCSMVLCLFGAG